MKISNLSRHSLRTLLTQRLAERWVHTVWQECLNRLFLLNDTHVQRVLREYIACCDASRPHQRLTQRSPFPGPPPARTGIVCCRPVLGGIAHDYYRAA